MQGFRSSINLQFDLPNPQLLDRYVLSSSHCEVLHGILEGVTQDTTHAHLLIGPYGTGKSLLSTIVCQLLSRQFSGDWQERLLAQSERIDTKLATRLRDFGNTVMTYVPVMINGRTGSLRTIINQAIFRALQQAGIPIATLNEASSILSTVDRWKGSYPDTYVAFLRHLEERSFQEEDWRLQIENCHEEPIRDFIVFYPTVTSGTPWTIEHEMYFVDNLERLSAELMERQTGLFIVYDEFGRFLQSLCGADALQSMQDLQDFAEFVNRTPNMHLLVVGHKHIRQYAASSRESIRTEFEKVEKRFRFYSLETDGATFLRLAQEANAETNALSLNNVAEFETVEELQSYPLFAEFTSYQLEHGIIQSLYPLHPVAVMLLPHLSNIFGQNERTLFSFLSDNERYSLRDHVHQHHRYYYADQLFDFFSIALAEYGDQPSLQLYHTIAPYLNGQLPLQRRIVELLTLCAATLLTQKQPVTTAFLAFSLGIAEDEAGAALDQMSKAKVVRYNSIRDHWELFDGSSIDLNAVVSEKITTTSLQGREHLALLERHLPMSYVLPYEYNDDMDMIRYADVRFTDVAELKSFDESLLTADDRIWLVLYPDADQIEEPIATVLEMAKPFLAAFPKFAAESVYASLLHYKIIDELLHDPAFLALDVRVKNELLYMLQETSIRIKVFIDRYLVFDELEWWSGTEQVIVKDLLGLERLVTKRLRNKYHETPLIRNEAFNRNRISAIQRRALIDVIDRVIQQPEAFNLGIMGYGPNYLIYASVLKNNGYTIDAEGRVECGGTLAAIKGELERRLDDQPVGKLSDLISMMEAPPYGIRSAVVPLLFVALLRERWDQLLFFSHDMLTTHLNGASVLELIDLSDLYEYRYYNWTAEERNQLQQLGQHFDLSAEACASFLHVRDAVLHWLRQLPKFSQITRQVSTITERIRDGIRAAEIDPYYHMKELASSGDLLTEARRELEKFLVWNEADLERQVLDLTGQASLPHVFEALRKLRNEAIGKNCKLLTLAETGEESGLIDRLAAHLVGVARTEWSDATQELFLSQIKYEWQLLHAGDEVAAASEWIVDQNVPLSKKSQTLYANVKNMLKYAGKDVPTQEVKQLLIKLLQEI